MTTVEGKRLVSKAPQLAWLNQIKGIAMIWLFLNHLAEKLFGGPAIANPGHGWPTLDQRVEQLLPMPEQGLSGLVANVLRYVGWGGDMAGVQLFILVSGFGLAWSLVNAPAAPLDARTVYRRRLARIYPEWLTIHILLGIAGTLSLLNDAPSVFGKDFCLSIIGIRFLPSTLYAFSPPWWFFGLLVQLYLVFPLLWFGVRRLNPLRLFLLASLTGFGVRAIGLLVFDVYLDAWSRGAIFITQLPIFALGIVMAVWFHDHPPSASPRQWLLLPAGIVVFLAGNALGLFLVGMTFAPFIAGMGSFMAIWPFVSGSKRRLLALNWPITWVGRHSLSFFLVHHLAIDRIGPRSYDITSSLFWARLGACLLATIVGSLLIERVASVGQKTIERMRARLGTFRTCLTLAGAITLALAFPLAAELVVRKLDPQEVLVWGEFDSLAPSDQFGWKLKPSAVTRLRWISYDYTVSANHLGFPGPAYNSARTPGSFRILTTGDAYTSAEGVDTEQAWPRVLERRLAQRTPDVKWEVLNFAITGYGPTQDAAVLEHFVPEFLPDVVVLEMFINDFEDEMAGQSIGDTIGFDRESERSSLKQMLRLPHFSAWMSFQRAMTKQRLSGKPSGIAQFFSGLGWLTRDSSMYQPEARARMRARLASIRQTVESRGAALIVMLVPGAIQVCPVASLPYMVGARVDESGLDMEGPQRALKELCQELGIELIDLRPVLSGDRCLYQPRNLHWLPEAHERVADYLAGTMGTLAQRSVDR